MRTSGIKTAIINMKYFFDLKYKMMNFQKVILASFCCICLIFSSNSLMAQTPQQVKIDEKKEVKENKMVLQKNKKTISKIEKEKKSEISTERKILQKKNILYGSPARIKRAKVDLERRKKQGRSSRTEILREEKRIKESETQIKKETKKVKKFSKETSQ